MADDLDVLIVGGGPAGMATAIRLAQAGVRTGVIERSDYQSPRIGEILPPGAKPLLRELGVWDAFCEDHHLPSPGIVSLWESERPNENDFYFSPYGVGWQLDRRRFDARLSLIAQSTGVRVYRSIGYLEVRRQNRDWLSTMRVDSETLAIRSRFMVDATGRCAWLARRLGARPVTSDRLVGIVGTITRHTDTSDDRRLLLEAAPEGWWYSALLPENILIAGYMTDADYLPVGRRDLRDFWVDHMQRSAQTRRRLRGDELRVSVRIVSANSYLMSPVGGNDWVAVGDAAMAWDPLSAQGILKALRDGISAATAIVNALQGDLRDIYAYRENVPRIFQQYSVDRMEFYNRVSRWPSSDFWKRRQTEKESSGHQRNSANFNEPAEVIHGDASKKPACR